MSRLVRTLAQEVATTFRRPGRLKAIFVPSRIGRYTRFLLLQWRAGGDWKADKGGTASKSFVSYQEYLDVQKSKLEYLDLSAHEAKFRRVLGERLSQMDHEFHGARVLCLGARLGAEVAAFRDRGAFAVGVDLNPGEENPWVLHGDFHALAYPDGVVDFLYTNSLDHSFDLPKVIAEVLRVLSDGGRFIVEADPGVEDEKGVTPDLWASYQWPTIDALASEICKLGFVLDSRQNFGYPRDGTCLVFAKSSVEQRSP